MPVEDVVAALTSIAPTDQDKLAKWDIFGSGDGFDPPIPGVGEVWVDTQFERVPGQETDNQPKPGTLMVIDARSFNIEREINGLDPDAEDS